MTMVKIMSLPRLGTRSKGRSRRLGVLAGLAAAALVMTACSPSDNSNADDGDSKAPIKVAGLFDLTGGNAAAGTAVADATKYAVEQINKKGGIQGRKIDLVGFDVASDPATAVLQYRKAVDQEGIKLILGPTYSPVASAICPLGEKDKVVIFTQSATNITVTTPFKKYCYGNAPTGAQSAKSIVKLLKSMGKKRIGMIKDSSVYGTQGVDSIKANLVGTDMTLEEVATIDVNATDGTTQATAMKNADLDAVVLAAVPVPGTAALKAYYQQGVDTPLYSFGGIFLPSTADLVTSSAPIEFYMASPASCPQAQFFTKCGADAKPAFSSEDQPGYGIFAYYPTQALFAALEKAEGFEPDQIVAALDSAATFETDFTLPLKYTADNHLGMPEQYLEGYKDGKVYFFGNDINVNTYKP